MLRMRLVITMGIPQLTAFPKAWILQRSVFQFGPSVENRNRPADPYQPRQRRGGAAISGIFSARNPCIIRGWGALAHWPVHTTQNVKGVERG
jgi:hypothetical protein